MIKASDLVALFHQAHSEGWGYIWGQRGGVWTQAKQDAATRDMTIKYGQQHVGKRVADCSGLFVWAFGELGASIYHGSNTIFNKYTTTTGAVGGLSTLRPGSAVFMVNNGRRTHIGLYVGEGKVIEAQGTRTGVVESTINGWDEWGELKGVEYDLEADHFVTTLPILRKGDTGHAVKDLQLRLQAVGCVLEADGIFGAKTLSFVLSFQRANGLKADGIVGPETWAKLDGEPPERETDDVTIPGGENFRAVLEMIRSLVEGALNG